MTNKLTTFKNAYINYMTRRGQTEVRRVLLTQSDHVLADMGISRELLEGGVSNWPWTVPAEDNFTLRSANNAAVEAKPAAKVKPSRREIATAIRELKALSDHELHDLGIDRGMIKDAVMNGRFGIERVAPVQVGAENATPSNTVIAATPKVAKVGVTQPSANDTDLPQPPMTPPSSGGGSRQAA